MVRNREIERLKGLGILMVLLTQHKYIYDLLHVPEVFRRSWGGADVFFVITGFLASAMLDHLLPERPDKRGWAERLDDARPALKKFFANRFFRIAPTSLFWTVIALSMYPVLFPSGPAAFVTFFIKTGLAIVTLSQNYLLAVDGVTYYRPTGPFWAGMVQIHFLILIPFFWVIFNTFSKRLAACMALILVLLPLSRLLPLPSGIPPENLDLYFQFATHRRIHAQFFGVFVFLLHQRGWLGSLRSLGKARLTAIAAFALLAIWTIFATFPDGDYGGSIVFFLVAALASILLMAASFRVGILSFGPCNAPLEYLGARSLELYLVSFPVRHFTRALFPNAFQSLGPSATLWTDVLTASLTLLVAHLSFQFFVKPVMSGKRLPVPIS